MPQPERKSQYTENVNAALQWMWGDGYLSPGGTEEVAAMLRGVDVGGRHVLEIGSDWLRGGEDTCTSEAREWLATVHLDFRMETLEQTRRALERSGFERVGLVDRNEWYKVEVEKEIATLSGDNYEKLVGVVGEETAKHRLESSTLKQRVIDQGFLRPTHFVGYKPAGA